MSATIVVRVGDRGCYTTGGSFMKYELGPNDIAKIEKAINAPRSPKVEVCIKRTYIGYA